MCHCFLVFPSSGGWTSSRRMFWRNPRILSRKLTPACRENQMHSVLSWADAQRVSRKGEGNKRKLCTEIGCIRTADSLMIVLGCRRFTAVVFSEFQVLSPPECIEIRSRGVKTCEYAQSRSLFFANDSNCWLFENDISEAKYFVFSSFCQQLLWRNKITFKMKQNRPNAIISLYQFSNHSIMSLPKNLAPFCSRSFRNFCSFKMQRFRLFSIQSKCHWFRYHSSFFGHFAIRYCSKTRITSLPSWISFSCDSEADCTQRMNFEDVIPFWVQDKEEIFPILLEFCKTQRFIFVNFIKIHFQDFSNFPKFGWNEI